MGTRADFYVGRGEKAEWLGSVALDGYPSGVCDEDYPHGKPMLESTTEEAYRTALAEFFSEKGERQVTLPEHGWPWPWETSSTTDYAYAFDGGKVFASSFGREWFDPIADPENEHGDDSKSAVFPNMKDRQNVTFGPRSGLLVFGIPSR